MDRSLIHTIDFVYRMECRGQNWFSSIWVVNPFRPIDDPNCLDWKSISQTHVRPSLGPCLLHESASTWSCQCHIVLMAATLQRVLKSASLCLLTLFCFFFPNDLKLWNDSFLSNKSMLSSWPVMSSCQAHIFMTEVDFFFPKIKELLSSEAQPLFILMIAGVTESEWRVWKSGRESWKASSSSGCLGSANSFPFIGWK